MKYKLSQLPFGIKFTRNTSPTHPLAWVRASLCLNCLSALSSLGTPPPRIPWRGSAHRSVSIAFRH